MKWRGVFVLFWWVLFFFCFEREQRGAPVSSPSSWPFLPCIDPQAPRHVPPSGNFPGVPVDGEGRGRSSPGSTRPRWETAVGVCSSCPSHVPSIRGGLKYLISLWFLSCASGYQSHLSFQLAFLRENVELKEMMATWTLQKGIPLVVVKREGRSLKLQQERFLSGVFKEDPEWGTLQERWLLFFPVGLVYLISVY